MNVAVIGAGRWGTNYIRTFRELGADVKWICEKSESNLKKAVEAANAGSAKTTADYKDVLEDSEVEAVAIITIGSTHYRIARDALKAGKHVAVEKPLAMSSKDAEELVKIAEEKGVVLMVGHLHMFNAAIRQIKKDIEAGFFGKISYINLIGTGNGPVRSDMSALWDFGPHDVSIASYLLGKYPESVSANGASYLKKGVEDVITMDMKFGDAIATAFGSWLYPIKRREVVVVGENMFAAYDDYAKTLKYVDAKGSRNVKFKDAKPLEEQLRHFIECVKSGKKPVAGGAEGAIVVKVLEAAEKSIKEGGKPFKT